MRPGTSEIIEDAADDIAARAASVISSWSRHRNRERTEGGQRQYIQGAHFGLPWHIYNRPLQLWLLT